VIRRERAKEKKEVDSEDRGRIRELGELLNLFSLDISTGE